MRKIILILISAILIQTVFVSCEKADNLPWPEETEYGVIATMEYVSDAPTLIYSTPEGLDTTSLDFKISTPFGGDYKTLQLVIAMQANGEKQYDYGKQYIIKEYSKPGTYTVNIDDIVNGVDLYSSRDDVTKGDKFNFFVNVVTTGGKQLYRFLPFKKPTVKVEAVQANTVYNVTPDKCNIDDIFILSIDDASKSAEKINVEATGQQSSQIVDDMIAAIDAKIIEKPTGKWASLVESYTNENGVLKVTAKTGEIIELVAITKIRNSDYEISGYDPNTLANPDFNFEQIFSVR